MSGEMKNRGVTVGSDLAAGPAKANKQDSLKNSMVIGRPWVTPLGFIPASGKKTKTVKCIQHYF